MFWEELDPAAHWEPAPMLKQTFLPIFQNFDQRMDINIHSFQKYLLSTYYMPVSIPDIEDTAMNKTDNNPAFVCRSGETE